MVSGGGSNLQSLIDYDGNYEISLVISDKPDVFGLERAKKHNIPAFCVGKSNFADKKDRNDEILRLLEQHKIDIVVLAGYLSIVDKSIIDKYENRIINIHPSLIPSFCGMGYYGKRVHTAVYNSGVKVSGATVHFVNTGVDTGEIIIQDVVFIENEDSIDDIASKVLKIEHKILPKALELVCGGNVKIENNRTKIGG